MQGDSDAALWLAATSGSQRAFVEIFDRYRKRVLAAAFRQTDSFDLAEEATAVVFLELWRLRKKVRIVDDSLLPWLFVVTTNVCRNLTRAKRRYSVMLAKLPPGADEPDVADGVGEDIAREETRRRVRQALASLDARDQVVVQLVMLEGYTVADAATALGLPVGTVKSRLYRARGRLRTILAPADIPWREEDADER
ncbi:RNA polymerase sigma factor [Microbacterium gorillae]|uniref:RNA polymerase sigma factor n=1 Tax=Microbacterium gorillae TaxID=1231063 RepID=UPI003D99C4E2